MYSLFSPLELDEIINIQIFNPKVKLAFFREFGEKIIHNLFAHLMCMC